MLGWGGTTTEWTTAARVVGLGPPAAVSSCLAMSRRVSVTVWATGEAKRAWHAQRARRTPPPSVLSESLCPVCLSVHLSLLGQS